MWASVMSGDKHNGNRSFGRRGAWPALLFACLLAAGPWACGAPPPEPAPVDPGVVTIIGDFGSRGGSFDSQFGSFRVLGFRFPALEGARIRVTLMVLSGPLDPVLVIYGPRSLEGNWGAPIARDDGGPGGQRAVSVGPLNGGLYLALVTTRDWPTSGQFRLTVSCEAGCDELPPACPPAPSCESDRVCITGYALDEDGCPTCECLDECRSDRDCGPEEACLRGRCEEYCTCRDPYEPVCGSDGVTYANRCEAGCAGAVVLSEGPCSEVCPALPCDLDCPSGYRRDADGCEICACLEPCEACDLRVEPVCTRSGVTRQNRCLAECRGEQVAYAGPCRAECPDLVCDLSCPGGYVRDASGCPICQCLEVVCPEVYDPVCGSDGVTYSNNCEAEAAGAEVLFSSPCPPRCHSDTDCPDDYRCRSDVLSLAECVDVAETTCLAFCILDPIGCTDAAACPAGDVCGADGACDSPCDCAPVYDPVCGADRITYDNACRARCAEIPVSSTGTCCDEAAMATCDLDCPNGYDVDSDGCQVCRCAEPTTCTCIEAVVNPVCGADGVLYQNECLMRCEGVGECVTVTDISAVAQICGADGVLYPNECSFLCAGVARCPSAADATGAGSICGADGRTYPNECTMECAGVSTASDSSICLSTDGG